MSFLGEIFNYIFNNKSQHLSLNSKNEIERMVDAVMWKYADEESYFEDCYSHDGIIDKCIEKYSEIKSKRYEDNVPDGEIYYDEILAAELAIRKQFPERNILDIELDNGKRILIAVNREQEKEIEPILDLLKINYQYNVNYEKFRLRINDDINDAIYDMNKQDDYI